MISIIKYFDTHKLGASFLAAGPILIQFGGNKQAWWIGLVLTVLGPLLMAFKTKVKHPKD